MKLGETEPKAEAPHVLDNLFALGTNAEAFDAADSNSADKSEIFLKSSIFKYFCISILCQKQKYCGWGSNIEDTLFLLMWCSISSSVNLSRDFSRKKGSSCGR